MSKSNGKNDYATRPQIAQAVIEAQAAKLRGEQMPLPLIQILQLIVDGLEKKYYMRQIEWDIVHTDSVMKIWQVIDRLDTNRNLFSYLTTICFNNAKGLWCLDERWNQRIKKTYDRRVRAESDRGKRV